MYAITDYLTETITCEYLYYINYSTLNLVYLVVSCRMEISVIMAVLKCFLS